MTPEREEQIRRWMENMLELEARMEAFAELTGMPPDSLLAGAVWHMAGEYTTAVDLGGDCAWFWLECDLGRRPLKASKATGDERKIATVEDLLWLMGIEE